MTKAEAIDLVQGYGETDGPEDHAEAAELFEAVFGRCPDADDGDAAGLFSQVCAAVGHGEQDSPEVEAADYERDREIDDEITGS